LNATADETAGAAPQRVFFATAPRGLSELLAQELSDLGAGGVRCSPGGVLCRGSLELGYRACLWSRVASRVLLELASIEAADEGEFYRAAAALDWVRHVDPGRTLACEFTGTHPAITHSHFGALRLKDAICDSLRAATGSRPNVALQRPAVRVVAHADGCRIGLWLDLAGEGLHRRGYRTAAGAAPLRENLAAGMLLRARWPEMAARGEEFLDPLCGSGTLVIEAALMASGRAPGLQREYFGFLGWRGHDVALWERLRAEARALARPEIRSLVRGSDQDRQALEHCADNARRAGVESLVRFECDALGSVRPCGAAGLICTNPPYGQRLGDVTAAATLHAELGRVLRERFGGWEAAILTAGSAPARELRLRSYRVHELWNGALPCRLLRIDLAAPGSADGAAGQRLAADRAAEGPGARMFAGRMEKNLRRLGRFARREQVSCYRLYDADMPEYAFAIDRYLEAGSGALHLHVQEYAAPKEIAEADTRRRRLDVLSTLPRLLAIPPERLHLRLRQRQRGAAQYPPRRPGAAAGADATLMVEEGGLKFRVDLESYLDTGLFLDQRLTRARLREGAAGTRFLNLFCYTGSATVYAAAGGARSSLSLDLSNRYLDWAARNFALNGLDGARHRLERADCREWLRAAPQAAFDLILLDPPTFSNSARMRDVLDIQRDHAELIEGCMRRLAAGGLLVFACNARRFRLDEGVSGTWRVEDISAATLPVDFARRPRIHRCFEIRARG
jgi:23S rRNA (guanine2445-N2)-methyltransferase / 23S rRNA (guanine2069-N7)-methyltransferase